MSIVVGKEEAHRLVDQVEKGLEDSKASRTKDVKEIRKNTDSWNEGSLD